MGLQKSIFTAVLILILSFNVHAQDVGLSFSYFLPKNGYFSTPISPFSVRGLGVDLTNFLAIETGASLYRMSGLNIKGLPFESKEPLVGPNFTIFVPLELVIQLRGQRAQFDIKGGGFFFHGFDQKINYGNFDRALRTYEQWEVVNSEFTFTNKPGFGYHGGIEFTFYVTSQVGVVIECNYLIGESSFPLIGKYSGGTSIIETRENISFEDARIDLTGLEISLGLIFDTSAGGPPKKAKKRKR